MGVCDAWTRPFTLTAEREAEQEAEQGQSDATDGRTAAVQTRTSVDADVVKSQPKVRHIGLELLEAQELARHKVGREEQLLGDGQHQGAEGGDVGLEGLAWG
jgi:hypothetical protein